MKMEVNLSCRVMTNKTPMLIQLRDYEVRRTSHTPIQTETKNLQGTCQWEEKTHQTTKIKPPNTQMLF